MMYRYLNTPHSGLNKPRRILMHSYSSMLLLGEQAISTFLQKTTYKPLTRGTVYEKV